ncbi:MAG: nickel/cobalt transporter [Rubrimonas sp.]|uniref:nickel/cobalt transporter n=1 Tax=Rubrimonas sp. TaxID=2036015 RepID=UPI002FDCEE65
MRLIAGLALVVALAGAAALWALGGFDDVARWAAATQREAQNAIAAAAQALRRGDPGAFAALLGVCALYGFAHAVGPGHGKVLIGGAALVSRAGLGRLVALSLVASLAQSATAILLTLGGLWLLAIPATQAVRIAEDALAPASGAAIAAIGALVLWRGARGLRAARAETGPGASCGCGHAHGPTPEQAERVHSLRDAAAIVAGVAIRPCTGAIFLLLIAARLDLLWAGIAGTFAMGLGAGGFTALVAAWGRAARGAALLAGSGAAARSFALLQIVGGAAIAVSGAALAATALA